MSIETIFKELKENFKYIEWKLEEQEQKSIFVYTIYPEMELNDYFILKFIKNMESLEINLYKNKQKILKKIITDDDNLWLYIKILLNNANINFTKEYIEKYNLNLKKKEINLNYIIEDIHFGF